MKELELYKFINDNNVEWHWVNNEGADDVIILPNFYLLEDFMKLQSIVYLSEDGIPCFLKDGYIGMFMADICEYYGIEIENVFPFPEK